MFCFVSRGAFSCIAALKTGCWMPAIATLRLVSGPGRPVSACRTRLTGPQPRLAWALTLPELVLGHSVANAERRCSLAILHLADLACIAVVVLGIQRNSGDGPDPLGKAPCNRGRHGLPPDPLLTDTYDP